jgi:hypothetical protein
MDALREQDRELAEFRARLEERGLHAALDYLNSRIPFRFTGVYRFDGDTLRNVALFDRWAPETVQGSDAPMAETFCALVPDAGGILLVEDGRNDPRYPAMAANAVVCYCGAVVRDADGEPVGTMCHFDVQHCEPPRNELALLEAATPFVHDYLAAQGKL